MGTTEATGRRRYRSELREQQAAATRSAVVDAARELFTSKGWAGTAMREVASAAGVSVETVYAHFASKKGLLRAVIEQGVVGDDEPVPLAGRPEFTAVGRGTRAERVAASAQMQTAIHVRTSALLKLLHQVAPSDPELADLLASARELRRQDVATGLELAIGRAPTKAERDGVWALGCPEVYLLLVEHSGWTPDEYLQWLEDMLERAVPRS